GHSYIGTEHILLGLARENGGVAARVLLDLGADAEAIRAAVVHELGGSPVVPQAVPRPPRVQTGGEPRRVSEPEPRWSPRELLLLGWLLFGVALGLGVLVGWLIWGA